MSDKPLTPKRAGGPKTAAGKASSARNSLKHGVYSQAWFDPSEQLQFDDLCQALRGEYTATSPTILIQIERLAMTMVKIRRLQKIENALYQRAQATASRHIIEKADLGLEQSQGAKAGAKASANVAQAVQIAQDSALPDIVRLDTLARYQVSLDRQLSKIIGEIQILHAANKGKPVQVIEQ